MTNNNQKKKTKHKGSSLKKRFKTPIPRKTIQNVSGLQYISFDITDEPMDDPTVPEELMEELNTLFQKLIKSPASIIPRLEELLEKYPGVPKLYNFLSAAYTKTGDIVKAGQYTEENYRKNPDYLFAKLNYAELCIQEGRHEKIPEILNHQFVIKLLYPERNVFHITEVVGFTGVIGHYFALEGNMQQVEICYRTLKDLAPHHPYTKKLGRYLRLAGIKNGLSKL
jgi:hypothetical protein